MTGLRSTPFPVSVDTGMAAAPELDVWDPEPPEPHFGPDGPFVATYPDIPGQAAHAALLEGRVAVRNGCVVAGTSDEGVTLVFPQSQVEPAAPPAVLHFRGQDYAEGDPISVGGSMYFAPVDVPPGCPTDAWNVSPY